MIFLNRLKELRKEKSVSLKEVADSVDLAESQLSYYENGKREPREKESWKKLADYYGVSVAYLMGISEQRIDEEKMLETTRNIYFDILETKELAPNIPLKPEDLKAFEYFNNEQLDGYLKKIVIKLMDMIPANSKKQQKVDDYTRIYVFSQIMLMYIETAKTNQNLIEYAANNLPRDIDINEYNLISNKIEIDLLNFLQANSNEFPNEITETLTNLVEQYSLLTTYSYDDSIDDKLQSEINLILKDAKKKISDLKIKYPDKPSDIKRAISLIPKGLYRNGGNPENRNKYSLDKLNLSEDTKQIIIQIVDSFAENDQHMNQKEQ